MTPQEPSVLEARKIAKSYSGRSIFKNVDLSLDQGVYAMQGPNGIGKSTLLGILCGAIEADAGEVLIEGTDLARFPLAVRRMLSYVPDEARVYPFLSGRELLQLVAHAKQADLDDSLFELVERFAVASFLDRRIDAMSLGTQKKYLLLAGFVGKPRLYVADEPSNGLDKRTRSVLAEHLRGQGEHSTVLFTSHDPDFIDQANALVFDMSDLLERTTSLPKGSNS